MTFRFLLLFPSQRVDRFRAGRLPTDGQPGTEQIDVFHLCFMSSYSHEAGVQVFG